MARCTLLFCLCLCIINSLAVDPFRDGTLEIIREEDAPESVVQHARGSVNKLVPRRRFLESLHCIDPKTPDNMVTVLEGHPYHLYTTVHVACNPGKHFSSGGGDNVNVTCLPLPHPCMCMTSWETIGASLLVYDFNCTAPKVNSNMAEDLSARQCHDPTPVNGALKVLSGVPFVISNITVEIECLHGLVFPDGTTTKTETCLPASTPVHVTGVWVPDFSILTCSEPIKTPNQRRTLKSTSKLRHFNPDDPQCPDPTPVNGTMKIVSGRPFSDGCHVVLTCDPGLVFPDGLSVWNLSCTPLPVIPNKVIWLPQYSGTPVCKEPKPEKLDSKEDVPKTDTQGDPQCPDPTPVNGTLVVVRGVPYSYGCTVILTCYPGLVFPDGLFVWNLTCLAVPYPNTVVWVPADKPKPICKAPVDPKEETVELEDGPYEAEPVTSDRASTGLPEVEGEHNVDYYEETYIDIEYEQDNGETIITHSENDIEGKEENEIAVDSESVPLEIEEEIEDNEEETENDKNENEIIENENQENLEHIEESHEKEIPENIEQTIEEIEETTNELTENIEEVEEIYYNYETDFKVEENTDNHVEEPEEETPVDEEEIENNAEYHLDNVEEKTPEVDEEIESEIKHPEEEIGDEENEETDMKENPNETEVELPIEEEEEMHITIEEVLPLNSPLKKGSEDISQAIIDSNPFGNKEDEPEEETEDGHGYPVDREDVVAPGYLADIQESPPRASDIVVPPPEHADDICSYPADTGPCRMYFKRYFFNSKTKECDMFVYGGCQGNKNRFETLEACKKACSNTRTRS